MKLLLKKPMVGSYIINNSDMHMFQYNHIS